MKQCIVCGSKKTSQWYSGPLCKKCYYRVPHIHESMLKYAAQPSTRYGKSKRQAISRGKIWELSLDDFCRFLKTPCHYCSNQLGSKDGYSSCLDRIDNNVGYTVDNVVPCCYICNTMRNEFLSVEETKVAVNAVIDLRKTKVI